MINPVSFRWALSAALLSSLLLGAGKPPLVPPGDLEVRGAEDPAVDPSCEETVSFFSAACPEIARNESYLEACRTRRDAGCLFQCMQEHAGDCAAMTACYLDSECEFYETGGVCDSSWMSGCGARANGDFNSCLSECQADISTDQAWCLGQDCSWGCYARFNFDIALCIQLAHCSRYSYGAYAYTIQSAACQGSCFVGFADCYQCPDEGNHNSQCNTTYYLECRNACPTP